MFNKSCTTWIKLSAAHILLTRVSSWHGIMTIALSFNATRTVLLKLTSQSLTHVGRHSAHQTEAGVSFTHFQIGFTCALVTGLCASCVQTRGVAFRCSRSLWHRDVRVCSSLGAFNFMTSDLWLAELRHQLWPLIWAVLLSPGYGKIQMNN